MKTVDYIIIGQGLAGTCLTYLLHKEGRSFHVIDKMDESSSSRVAAGVYNPMVFKRLTKSWRADEIIPMISLFYPELEEFLRARFFHPRPILRLFGTQHERDDWEHRVSDPKRGKYLSPQIREPQELVHVVGEFGGAEVHGAGNVDVTVMLRAFRTWLVQHEAITDRPLDYKAIDLANDQVQIILGSDKLTAKRLVFCEGSPGIRNPWFGGSAFKLTKGELLTINTAQLTDAHIISKGCLLVPLGNGIHRVGATYEWEDLSPQPSSSGRKELEQRLRKAINVPYKVVDHKAGVRPTVKDRRPLLGTHPQYSQLSILNGLGTKGVMLAPYCAQRLIDHLERDIELDPEIAVGRYSQETPL